MAKAAYASVLLTFKKKNESKAKIQGLDMEISIKGLFGWCIMQVKTSPKDSVVIGLIEVSKSRTGGYHLNIETITPQSSLFSEQEISTEDSAQAPKAAIQIDLSEETGAGKTIIETLDGLFDSVLAQASKALGEGEITIINVKISQRETDDFSPRHF